MTNDVEKIIIDNEEEQVLNYAENKAYMLYKEIWKFLLYVRNNNFDTIRINFSYRKDNEYGYVNKQAGITYTMINNNEIQKWHNYYHGCTNHYIDVLFNTNIDMKLFFKLIAMDDFSCNYLDDGIPPVLVCIDITKEQIEKKINETLVKNKILIKKSDRNDRIN